MTRNELFLRFARALMILLLLYGAGMLAVALFGSEVLAVRMINGFAAMFSAVLGLGAGYLLGRSDRTDDPERKN